MQLMPYETDVYTWDFGDCRISTDRRYLDINVLHAAMRQEAYWARELEIERLAQAVRCSLPFGAYDAAGALMGFCRVVTDGAMFAYLRDVLIVSRYRGRGLGVELARRAVGHPDLANVHNWLLRTVDAHGVYAKIGFAVTDEPQSYMTLKSPRTPFRLRSAPGTASAAGADAPDDRSHGASGSRPS